MQTIKSARYAASEGWEPIHNWRPSDRGDRIRQEADGTWSRKAHQAQPSETVAEAAVRALTECICDIDARPVTCPQ